MRNRNENESIKFEQSVIANDYYHKAENRSHMGSMKLGGGRDKGRLVISMQHISHVPFPFTGTIYFHLIQATLQYIFTARNKNIFNTEVCILISQLCTSMPYGPPIFNKTLTCQCDKLISLARFTLVTDNFNDALVSSLHVT
jgi:hypothetical protein